MPLYEYECKCGQKMEEFRSMGNRHNVICPSCGGVPQITMSLTRVHQSCITLTVFDGDGKVIGQRHDHHRTPTFTEYHSKEVCQRAEHGQEMAAKEMIQEREVEQEKKLARQV